MKFEDTKFYTVQSVALTLKVNESFIEKQILKGKIKAFKIGKEYRITSSAIDEYLKSLSTVGNTEAADLLKDAREGDKG